MAIVNSLQKRGLKKDRDMWFPFEYNILKEGRDSLLWKVLDHIPHFSYKGVDLTNQMWFSVVCTLIDNHMRHNRGQNIVDSGLLSATTN